MNALLALNSADGCFVRPVRYLPDAQIKQWIANLLVQEVKCISPRLSAHLLLLKRPAF